MNIYSEDIYTTLPDYGKLTGKDLVFAHIPNYGERAISMKSLSELTGFSPVRLEAISVPLEKRGITSLPGQAVGSLLL